MKRFFKKFFTPTVKTLNTIFIDQSAILHNIQSLRQHTKTEIFPVLKSNAYGHGILQMLQIFKNGKQNFPYLVVDSYPEYKIIEKNSRYNVLLLSETWPENYYAFHPKRTTFVIYNISTLEVLENQKIQRKIHIFLNTGMNREWIDEQNLEKFLQVLKKCKYISLDGVLSHFHSADENTNESIQTQIAQFKKMSKKIEENGFSLTWKHINASSGTLRVHDDFFNASRVWLSLYGYFPSNIFSEPELRPALSLQSTIVSIHDISSGDGVSYNHRWKAQNDTIVATIPFWYFEWFARNFREKIFYKFQNKFFSQIGTICMNYSSCIGDKNMKIGDSIELISQNPDDKNSLENIAKNTDTLIYEILVKLDKHIRRIVK